VPVRRSKEGGWNHCILESEREKKVKDQHVLVEDDGDVAKGDGCKQR
jgi:hypothetical protein